MTNRRWIPLVGVAGALVLGGLILTQFGCPPQPIPPTPGVAAGDVQNVLNQRFNAVDRTLALWSVQPTLSSVMIEYALRFFMMQKAAEAGDWAMAQYQLTEQAEIQRVGEKVTSSNRAALLRNFELNFLNPLATDIQNKNLASFNTHFTTAITGCNNCHAVSEHGYVVIQPATQIPQVNLALAPSDPIAPEEPESTTSPTPPFAADQALTGAEVNQLIDFYFNTPDPKLALWSIQPGLGTVMIEYGLRFAMMKLAADAGNWGMAQYQLARARDIQAVAATTRPNFADQLNAFATSFLDPLGTVISAQDATAFNTAYTNAMNGCNACHVANNHAFIRVQQPTRTPQPILTLTASPAQTPPATPTPTANPPTIPDTPTLADASAAISFRFNNIDRTLALWNIQRGLGSLMIENGYHFNQTWFSGEALDWPMVAYQVQQTITVQDRAETLRPDVEQGLESFEQISLGPIQTSVNAQNKAGFETGYSNAVTNCNACHQSTGAPFVTVQVPTQPYFDYIKP